MTNEPVARLFQAIDQDRSTNRYVITCRDYIRTHLCESITREALSNACGLSEGYLSGVFAQELHCSIPAYVMREKLDAACRMLSEQALTITEICYHLDFCSQSYFTECFRREIGCTPGQYRRLHSD